MTLVSLVLSWLECLSVRQQVSPEHFNLLFMTGFLSEGYLSRETPSSFLGTDKKKMYILGKQLGKKVRA